MTVKEILLSLPHKKEQRNIFVKYGKFKTCKKNTFSDLVELNCGTYKGVPISFTRIRSLTSGFFHVYAIFLPSECPLGRFLLHERAHTCLEGWREGMVWAGLYVVINKKTSEVSVTGRNTVRVLLRSSGGSPGSWTEPFGKPKQQPLRGWGWARGDLDHGCGEIKAIGNTERFLHYLGGMHRGGSGALALGAGGSEEGSTGSYYG